MKKQMSAPCNIQVGVSIFSHQKKAFINVTQEPPHPAIHSYICRQNSEKGHFAHAHSDILNHSVSVVLDVGAFFF